MASLQRLPGPRKALFAIPSTQCTCSPPQCLATRHFHSILPRRPPVSPPTSTSVQPKKTSTSPRSSTRTYYSALHPRLPPHEYTHSQTAILTASLPHIPTHGFTIAALTRGARDAGFLDVSVQLLPRGEFDLVLFWLASRRGLLRGRVEEGDLFGRVAAERGRDWTATSGRGEGGLTVEEKIKILVMERLRMNKDIKGVWQDALAQMSLLGNIPLSLLELHALSNDILTLAGDSAVDATWYARRMGVGAIYASAEIVMTRDPTPDLVETEAFVQRRFEDKEVLKEKVEGVSSWVGFWGNTVVGLGRSWGLKI